jgi:hypothetical protein
MTSWVRVASSGIGAEGASEQNINQFHNENFNGHSTGGAAHCSQQSILLLQEALKSRKDLLTGGFWE